MSHAEIARLQSELQNCRQGKTQLKRHLKKYEDAYILQEIRAGRTAKLAPISSELAAVIDADEILDTWRRKLEADTTQSTHWAECWACHPRCALWKLIELRDKSRDEALEKLTRQSEDLGLEY